MCIVVWVFRQSLVLQGQGYRGAGARVPGHGCRGSVAGVQGAALQGLQGQGCRDHMPGADATTLLMLSGEMLLKAPG